MKQKIYYLGLFTLILVITGTIFKLQHWPGAGYMLVIGISTLVLLFLPLALRSHYKAQGSVHLLFYLVTWFTALVVFSGMLFKIQHWPGAGTLILISLPFPYLVFLPVYLLTYAREKNHDIYHVAAVLLLLAGVSVFSALLSLNVSKEKIANGLVLSGHYDNVLRDRPSPYILPAVSLAVDEILSDVEQTRDCILRKASPKETLSGTGFIHIRYIDSRALAWDALMKDEENSPVMQLQESISRFVREIESLSASRELTALARKCLDYPESVSETHWAEYRFSDEPLAWVLVILDALEYYAVELEWEATTL